MCVVYECFSVLFFFACVCVCVWGGGGGGGGVEPCSWESNDKVVSSGEPC